ncbi:flavodoxin domain-containing protein [Roseomonas sp. AR75]|uniref:flavodoxin domain-containing protein n=1 Tax=Roseomonas sp. AR75 TaxID=2562311 RepID=UPI001484F91F|nr:flavodoxin domain-containing protein [Roseomonas sp. AR75]
MAERRGALIVYATTSGATAEVARLIADALRHPDRVTFDLRNLDVDATLLPPGQFELVVAGTPTYGKGDWHSAWQRHGGRVVPLLRSAARVMLFGLGDARGHAATFAGGLRMLHDFVVEAGVRPLGPPQPSPAGRVPDPVPVPPPAGLAIEYRRNRRAAPEAIREWLSACLGDDVALRAERPVI